MTHTRLHPALFLACAAVCAAAVLTSCRDTSTILTSNTERLLVDQQYYPTMTGTSWSYRIDTIGVDGVYHRDVARKTARITGTTRIDTLEYAVQISETTSGPTSVFDTLYLRKDAGGVYLSSPQLRAFSLIQGIPGFSGFPKEYLVIPASMESQSSWDIIRFDFNQIPLVQIYVHVTAAYLGRESIQTETTTYKQCAKIRLSIDAKFPNPQNPQDILHPIQIRETADFWMARPLGLVVGDGSEALFTLLDGRIPFSVPQRRRRQEIEQMDIVQPADLCIGIVK